MKSNQRINTNENELLDELQLATRLDVSRSTLQSWRYAGKGPRYVKLGRLIRYRTVDVDQYLRSQTRGPSLSLSSVDLDRRVEQVPMA